MGEKLLIVLIRCDGSFRDSAMFKHVIVFHYLPKTKQTQTLIYRTSTRNNPR